MTLYKQRSSIGSWTGAIAVNDIFTLRRSGSVFYVLKNGVVIITSASGQPTGDMRAVLSLGGSANVSVTLGDINWVLQAGATDMTLLPPASVSLSASPPAAVAYILWRDDSGTAVLGTDLTVDLSRDGGTTWTAATLTTLAAYDGTYSLIKARADLSAQPAGTSLTCCIKTLNTKAQRVAAPALYAE